MKATLKGHGRNYNFTTNKIVSFFNLEKFILNKRYSVLLLLLFENLFLPPKNKNAMK